MIQKLIPYFGTTQFLTCDGRCDKAWGINLRPAVYFDANGAVVSQRTCNDQASNVIYKGQEPPNHDDMAYLADAEVGMAPARPQTWEGGDGKPAAVTVPNSDYMNKWCSRQCERSIFAGAMTIKLPFADPNARLYNIPTSKVRAEQRDQMIAAGVNLSTVKWDPAKQTFIKV